MNHVYRLIRSKSHGQLIPVPEHARSVGKSRAVKRSGRRDFYGNAGLLLLGLGLLAWGTPLRAQTLPGVNSNQLPTGGSVAAGQATIQPASGSVQPVLQVQQSSQRAIIDWSAFNVGRDATVNFAQTQGASSVTLNRVLDANPSQIFGRITAPGQVFISNPQGVLFGRSAQLDVGGLVATTHQVNPQEFMQGRFRLERMGATGTVRNEGSIKVAPEGYVALVADSVNNTGSISAPQGSIVLAAGERLTLQVDGKRLTGIEVEAATVKTLVENGGALIAEDGQILLSSRSAEALMGGVVRHNGVSQANSLVAKGGRILLEGDDVTVGTGSLMEAKGATGGGEILVGGGWQGTGSMHQATRTTVEAGAVLDASATQNGNGGTVVVWSNVRDEKSVTTLGGTLRAEAGPNGGDGGRIETSGHDLQFSGAQVSTKAVAGKAGNWLLDPYNYTIDAAQASTISTALGSGNVTVDTATDVASQGSSGNSSDVGNIALNSGISWSTANSLTFNAAGGLSGSGGIAMSNAGASFVVNQAGNSSYAGVISGAGALRKTGAGTLTLSGANTYTGATTIAGGVLSISADSNLGTAPGTFVANQLVLDGGTLQASDTFSFAQNRGITVGAGGGAIDVSSGKTLTFPLLTTPLTNTSKFLTGTGDLRKTGAGTLATNAWWSNTGALAIEGGRLKAVASGQSVTTGVKGFFGSASSIRILNGGTLEYSGTTANGLIGQDDGVFFPPSINVQAGGTLEINQSTTRIYGITLAGGTISGNQRGVYARDIVVTADSTISGPSRSLASNYVFDIQGNAKLTVSGVLENANGNPTLTKQGTGTLTLSGANLYTGATVVNAGTLEIANATGLGTTAAGTTVAAGAVLDLQNVAVGAEALTLNGGTLKTSTGTSSLLGAITLGANSTVDVSGTQLTLSGAISGTGTGITKTGTGTVVLSGPNAYSGSTTVSAGTLKLGSAGSGSNSPLGTTGGGTTVASGAVLDLNGYTLATAEALTLNGGMLQASTGTSTWSGAVTLGNSTTSTISSSSGASLTVSGAVSATSGNPLAFGGGGNISLNNASNSIAGGISTSSTVGGLSVLNGAALTVNAITSTGSVDIATTTGDLTLAGNVTTTSTTGTAISLNAGKDTLPGTSTGGNIVFSGSPSISLGGGGTAKLFTGSVAGSTGIATLASAGTESYFRYNADESTNFSAGSWLALGAGKYVIYREQPTVTVAIDNKTITYGDSLPAWTFSLTGNANSDSFAKAFATNPSVSVSGTTSTSGNYTAATTHNLNSTTSLTSKLGYAVNGSITSGSLTVNQKTLTGASIAGVQTTYGTAVNAGAVSFGNVVGSDLVTATANIDSPAYSTSNTLKVGSYSQTAGTTLGGADAGNYTFVGFTTSSNNYVVNQKALTISGITASDKVYDGTTAATVSTAGVTSAVLQSGGMVAGDSVTVAASGTFGDKNVGSGKTVSLSSSYGGAGAGNYTITGQASTTAAILPVPTPAPPPAVTPVSPPVTSNPRIDRPNFSAANPPSGSAGLNSVLPQALAVTVEVLAPSLTASQLPKNAATQIVVTVPKEISTRGLGFMFPLPEEVLVQAGNSKLEITLIDGSPLPSWLTYDSPKQVMVSGAVPDGALPVRVRLRWSGGEGIVQIVETGG